MIGDLFILTALWSLAPCVIYACVDVDEISRVGKTAVAINATVITALMMLRMVGI